MWGENRGPLPVVLNNQNMSLAPCKVFWGQAGPFFWMPPSRQSISGLALRSGVPRVCVSVTRCLVFWVCLTPRAVNASVSTCREPILGVRHPKGLRSSQGGETASPLPRRLVLKNETEFQWLSLRQFWDTPFEITFTKNVGNPCCEKDRWHEFKVHTQVTGDWKKARPEMGWAARKLPEPLPLGCCVWPKRENRVRAFSQPRSLNCSNFHQPSLSLNNQDDSQQR